MSVYPDNTVAKFCTKLANAVILDGSYEVGLSEIIYPRDYYNIDNRDKLMKFTFKGVDIRRNTETGIEELDEHVLKRKLLRNALYTSDEEFIESLNEQVSAEITTLNLPATITFSLDRKGRILINIQPQTQIRDGAYTTLYDMYFQMSAELGNRLGFDGVVSLSMLTSKRENAKSRFDLNMGNRLMYVYCDIVAHGLVGDVSAPLLRVCNIPQPIQNECVHVAYTDVHYKPVQKKEFDTIDVSINSERGLTMPFQSGKSLLTLHFRRRNDLVLK